MSTLVTLAAVVRDLAVAGTVGGLLVVMTVVTADATTRALALARASAITWVVAAVTYLVAAYADIARVSPADADFGTQLWRFMADIDLGKAYALNVAAALITSLAVTLARKPSGCAWALIPVAYGIGTQALTGHAAGAANHHLAVSALYLHIAASAVWLGVLMAVAVSRTLIGLGAKDAVRRMSRLALWAAITLTVSGVANATLRIGKFTDLFTTGYGRLLAVKLVLMAVAIALAAWHRTVTMPRLDEAEVRDRFWRVLSLDVLALVAVAGIGGLMSRTAPTTPIEVVPEPTPAFLLTGYELPPAPEAVQWISQWRLEIVSAFVIVALCVVYVRWVRRLAKRGDAWPWYRTASFLTGMALIAWITQGAPAVYGVVSFSSHMLEHMLLAMAAPLPIVMAAPVTLALRALPARHDGTRGPREWIRVIVDSRVMKVVAHPVFAAVNFAGSLVVFYFTDIFPFVLGNHAGHIWMVVHFTFAGYLFANALIGIDPGPTRAAYPMRVLLLFATMAFHAFFGVAITSSEVLLAPRWYGLMGRDWGPDAITDQQLGGAIAWGLGEIPVVLLAVAVLLAWRRDDARTARRKDRAAERSGDADLEAYNAMLARLRSADSDSEAPRG